MAIWTHHPRADLLRYVSGEVQTDERTALEAHLTECADCRNFLSFVRDLRAGFAELTEGEFTTKEPCPDGWTIVSYEAGYLGEEASRRLRAHLLVCDACADSYYALLRRRPKVVEVILRVARGLIECLRIPDAAEWQSLPAKAQARGDEFVLLAPFMVEETLTDPDTEEAGGVTLRVEEGFKAETVRVIVKSERVARAWRVCLRNAEGDELESSLLAETRVEMRSQLPYGFYTLDVFKGEGEEGEQLGRFKFTVEPFNLPEAIETTLEYLRTRQYSRALAIVQSASRRYQDSRELLDLLCVAQVLAAGDPEGFRHEQNEGIQARSFQDFVNAAWQSLKDAKARFGERLATVLTTAALDPSTLPENLAPVEAQQPSLALLRALALLNDRLAAAETRQVRLIEVINNFTSRLEALPSLIRELEEALGEIRSDIGRDSDEKFAAVGEALDRLDEQLRAKGLLLPSYEPFFVETLGRACWSWLGQDAQRMLLWAEAVYRYLGSQPTDASPDFSPALLQYCRAFELLVNAKLGLELRHIGETVQTDENSRSLASSQLPRIKLDKFLVPQPAHTFSLVQASNVLRLGRVIVQQKPGVLRRDVEAVLPKLTDVTFCIPLGQVGNYYRNGKIHPRPGWPSALTPPEEIKELRKLIMGLDEERIDGKSFLNRLRGADWMTESERKEAWDALASAWGAYPGLVMILWKALESPGAS